MDLSIEKLGIRFIYYAFTILVFLRELEGVDQEVGLSLMVDKSSFGIERQEACQVGV